MAAPAPSAALLAAAAASISREPGRGASASPRLDLGALKSERRGSRRERESITSWAVGGFKGLLGAEQIIASARRASREGAAVMAPVKPEQTPKRLSGVRPRYSVDHSADVEEEGGDSHIIPLAIMERRQPSLTDQMVEASKQPRKSSVKPRMSMGEPVPRVVRRGWLEAFQEFRYDGEIHADDLPRALQRCGFEDCRLYIVASVLAQITDYNTLDQDEYLDFMRMYEEQLRDNYLKQFQKFDPKFQGRVQTKDLRRLLASLELTPRLAVIHEIVAEVGNADLGLCFTEFERLLELVRFRHGFLRQELDQFQSVFKVFDRDHSGRMQVSELSSALIWLGFPITSEQISSLYEGNDIDGNGTLGEAEFLRCLETLYEDEAEGIRRFLEETDGRCQNGGQLLELLEELGYVDASDAILDALRESNVDLGKRPPVEISDDLPLDLGADELSNVLCKLRAREGFTDAEMRELKEAFQMQASGKCEEIACPAIQKALRWLGHSYAFEVVQHFVGELDVDCDGRLDFTLFVKLIRKCRDLERRAATAAFQRLDALGLGFLDDGKQCQAFQSLGCLDAVGNPPPRSLAECSSADLPTFLNIVQRYKFSASRLRELRINAGYSELELAALRTHFQRFDKDGNGVLRKSELVQLIEELFPRHSNQREFRPYFIQLLGYADADGNDCLDFPEFVRMIRKISDHMEEQNYESFNKSLDELRFTTKEAAEFRGLFLQADQSGTCMLSFADVKSMIARCCVLDAEQSTKLLGFCRSAVENSSDLTSGLDKVNFLAFLRIMRDVIDAGWVPNIG